jgi:hypothetical protein
MELSLLCFVHGFLLFVTAAGQEKTLPINYQRLQYQGDNITIGLKGDGLEGQLGAQLFTRDAIVTGDVPLRYIAANDAQVSIPLDEFLEDNFVRFVVQGEQDAETGSGPYYRFPPDGKLGVG